MAGFRFKIEEKDLLVNIVKMAVARFDEQTEAMLKRGDDPLLVVGAKKNADTARNILAKIEGTFSTDVD